MRLTWQSNIVSGSTTTPAVALSQSANRAFAARFAFRNSPRNARSAASGRRPRSWPWSTIQLSPIACEIASASAGFASRSHLRGVTPFVLLLNRSGKISARSLTVVVRSRPVCIPATPLVLCEPTIARFAMRTCLAALFDQAHALNTSSIAREPCAHVIQKSSVNLEDDLQVPRQQQREPCKRPLFERLGEQGVVGVSERTLSETPRLVPTEVRFVEEDAHELRDRKRRVSVVELESHLVGHPVPVRVPAPEAPSQIGQRTGDQKVFLDEAQSLTARSGIVGV